MKIHSRHLTILPKLYINLFTNEHSIQAHFQSNHKRNTMSTRGLIAIMDEDGSCRSIYCYHDMYPSHAGVVLPEHYATREALLALGVLSTLGCSPAECNAYFRDRGEELHEPTQWSGRCLAREALDRFWASYCYLFMDGGWFCSDGGGWTPVADWLE